MTFAKQAIEGFEVPWTSNPVERLMGEVSKWCKNQWMRWTKEGLEAILQLRLVKYADQSYYQSFLDELLQRPTKTAMSCDLSIESCRVSSIWLCSFARRNGCDCVIAVESEETECCDFGIPSPHPYYGR